jgi:hypothetical protein
MTSLTNPTPQPQTSPTPNIAANASETIAGGIDAGGPLAPPKAQPQTPPMTDPPIIATRLVKPESEPDVSQAPKNNAARNNELEGSANNGTAPDNESTERNDGGLEDRQQENSPANHRRLQGRSERADRGENYNRNAAPYDEDEPQRLGPRLIQWNGDVTSERVITIEMPGVPGTIEIPRAYRNRVGVIESPSHNNNWRYAVLRVFGQGPVTILVRWWPMASKMVNFSVR